MIQIWPDVPAMYTTLPQAIQSYLLFELEGFETLYGQKAPSANKPLPPRGDMARSFEFQLVRSARGAAICLRYDH